MALQSINPATEELLASFEEFSADQLDEALERGIQAFGEWRRVSFDDRSRLMRGAASHLREEKERLAGLTTAEMGKPIIEAEAEIEKCAWNCDFYADNAGRFLARQTVGSNAAESYVAFEPLGPVLAIMPWNFPFWQVFRFAAPALMAGNVGLLKHASNVSQCALAIENTFRAAGFPEGVFQTLLASGQQTEALIDDARIRAVTLTGSDITGSKVGAASGRALKKSVLELGGSDPFIVLADADIAAAAETGVRARNQNTGQSCIAAKRFIVVESVADEFEQRFIDGVAHLKVGDPMQRETQIGPLARGDLRDGLEDQVRRSVDEGARLALGGHRMEGRGYFYAPTVLIRVTPEMAAAREETFGPVAALIRARDADEAIAIANNTPFGLGANLWTRDLDRARLLAKEVQAGSVFINGMVASDPRLPFGGIKRSGYGRELSEFGIREFVNIQTVWIGPAGERKPDPGVE
ncbi:MAG: NAD-dependent succinate-semialdehyde dehydrogenase [Chloroflexi bacterium]|nr:MAG: NAD-dependent succinate-semialdehyde dehydrogenase [Chloroflexota bacterium]